MSNPEGANLDAIAKRFTALEHAWKTQAGTKQVNAGFASVRAAVDKALADRAAWIKGPAWVAKPLSARAERAIYLAPEAMAPAPAAVDESEAVEASPLVKCPRCLRPDADRGDVEMKGVCLDCSLAGHAVAAEPMPGLTVPAEPPARLGAPPLGSSQDSAAAVPVPLLHVVTDAEAEAGE